MDELDFGNGTVQTDNTLQSTTSEITTTPNDESDEATEIAVDNTQESDKSESADNTSSTGELEEGTVIEFDGATYTVVKNGDIVDNKGNVFKEAKDVKEWIDSMNVENNTNDEKDIPLTLQAIQNALNISVTTEDGKPAEFTNDAEGVKAYVKAVLDIKSNELQEAAINRLYNSNPMLKQFQDYLVVNNGDPRGFGELPDRTGIRLDKDNERQLEAVIRTAAHEFGNKSFSDNYIKYLKDSGALYDVALEQLQALQAKDKQTRENIKREAQARRDQEAKEVEEYYNRVNDIIASRNIAGYKIPETFIREVNGQKITLTPSDFFNYLYRQDVVADNGTRVTGYQMDLARQSQEDALTNEMLQAWLMFTGGSYKDLVDMAIKDEQVKRLVVTSKQNRTAKTIKINKPQRKVDINDIVL